MSTELSQAARGTLNMLEKAAVVYTAALWGRTSDDCDVVGDVDTADT